MSESFRFEDRVIIVTGAGRGLGRAYASLLASRGASVVVNDLGSDLSGLGENRLIAEEVVEEITADGGNAVANTDSVEDGEKIVQTALDAFGRIDAVVNNAGVIRDKSFHKMTVEEWDVVHRVHLTGAFLVTRAAWPHFRAQEYGRVVFASSASGIFGNFGQANYGAAKLGLYGLTRTLAIEGQSKNILVNAIAPAAASRMTYSSTPKEIADRLKPEAVSPLVAYLCHETCRETGGLYEAIAGWIRKYRWERSTGVRLDPSGSTLEEIHAAWAAVNDFTESTHPASAEEAFGDIFAEISPGP